MPGQHPRDFSEYLKKLERDIARAGRAPIAIVNGAIEVIHQEQAARDSRRPTKPIELTWQTAAYTTTGTTTTGPQSVYLSSPYQGQHFIRLIVDFPDVTKATDGTDLTVDYYQLWGRDVSPTVLDITTSAVAGLAAPGLTAPGLAATPQAIEDANAGIDTELRLLATSNTSSFRVDGLPPGATYEFTARAIAVNAMQPGVPSDYFTVQLLDDTTPPPQPTQPVVTSERGQLVVTHDGQAVTGAMPADLSYILLAHGGDAQPTQEVARFGRAGGIHVQTGIAYYDPRFFRARAVDEAGNEGPWSAVAMGYVEPMVDTDIILSELDAAKTHLKNVDAGVSILPDTIITEHLRVTEDMSAKLGQFLHLKAGQIDVNDLWADNAFLGQAEARLIRSDIFMGKAFEGGTFTLTYGGKFQTDPLDLSGVKITQTGIQAWDPVSGDLTFEVDAGTGRVLAVGSIFTDYTGSRVQIGDSTTSGGSGIAGIEMWADFTSEHGSYFMFYNADLDGYATQATHYGPASNTIPASYLQLRDESFSLKLGDYPDQRDFIFMERGEFSINSQSGFVWSSPTDLNITHEGTDVGSSNPFMRLTQGERKIIVSTSAPSTNTNDYAMMQIVPTAVFHRQNNNNFTDLTPTYWAAVVNNQASGATTTSVIQLAQHTFEVRTQKNSRFVIQSNGNWEIGNAAVVDTYGRGRIIGGLDELVFYPTGAGTSNYNYLWLRHAVTAQITGGLNVYGGLSVMSGTKNFVMSHPTKIGRELVHAATESPWSGIHYWGTGTLNEDGFWIVELPEYFEHIAAKDQRLIFVTSPSGEKLVWDHEIVNGEFMIEGPAGAPFGWEVLARREGYEFEVEPWVSGRRNAGEPEIHHPPEHEEVTTVEDDVLKGRKFDPTTIGDMKPPKRHGYDGDKNDGGRKHARRAAGSNRHSRPALGE